MRNGGFRISSWTGLCAGSASIQLIGRQLKFQLSSSFNLLEQCCTTLVSVGSENILKQLHSYSAWSKEHGFQTPNTHTHVCVCVHQWFASPFMVPTLLLFAMWALLTETNAQAMQQTCTSKFYRTPPAFMNIYSIYIYYKYMYSICFISEKQEGLWRLWNVTIHVNLNHVF